MPSRVGRHPVAQPFAASVSGIGQTSPEFVDPLSVYCCRSPTQVQSPTSRRAYRVRCRFLCFAATLPVLFSVCHRSECKSHRERIKAVAASSRLPSQIFRSSSKQTTFCTDALLNDLGDASVFDGERVVVCVAHFLRHVVQPTKTVG